MSLLEIENAIRQLPPEDARVLLQRVSDLHHAVDQKQPLTSEMIDRWRVRSGFAAGMTTDEYLKLVRGGDRD
jgi:hypothetical protein